MKLIDTIAFLLTVVGGLNWLLFGLLGWDISVWLGGMDSVAARAIYVLVGLSAVVELATHKNTCKMCNAGDTMAPKIQALIFRNSSDVHRGCFFLHLVKRPLVRYNSAYGATYH
ncbi:MAG: DUF378 domain-containing protein [Candidatus Sungbacteria bacterium]|nr:DUF378 domain-containing protein [Candidatus Sungbacteria bacterium]